MPKLQPRSVNDVTLHLSRRQLAHWLALLTLGGVSGDVLVLTPFEACGFAVISAELKEDGDILLMDWSCPQVRGLRARFGHYSAASLATRLQQGEFMEGLSALVDTAAELAGYAVNWCWWKERAAGIEAAESLAAAQCKHDRTTQLLGPR